MKIRIETDNDRLFLENDVIKAIADGVEHTFNISEVEAALILTTDLGPFYDDMGLALRIDSETAVFIMSSHPDYKNFLFDEFGKTVAIDYNEIIKASTCTENKIFVIYKKEV